MRNWQQPVIIWLERIYRTLPTRSLPYDYIAIICVIGRAAIFSFPIVYVKNKHFNFTAFNKLLTVPVYHYFKFALFYIHRKIELCTMKKKINHFDCRLKRVIVVALRPIESLINDTQISINMQMIVISSVCAWAHCVCIHKNGNFYAALNKKNKNNNQMKYST